EPIVLALGIWGMRASMPNGPTMVSATSVLIYLRMAARLDPRTASADYRIEMDGRVWTVRTADGRVYVEVGEPGHPVASLRTDPKTLNALLEKPSLLDNADVHVSGDRPAL